MQMKQMTIEQLMIIVELHNTYPDKLTGACHEVLEELKAYEMYEPIKHLSVSLRRAKAS